MTGHDAYLKTAYVMALANGYPPLLRDELLSRPGIVERDGIETDATITLGPDDLSFRRSQLLSAIDAAYDRVSAPVIKSVAGDEWSVRFVCEVEPPNVALESGGQRLLVAQFALLAPEAEARLHAFQLITGQHHLPGEVIDRWRALLSERGPTDHEIMVLRDELQNTPIGEAEAIRESLKSGGLSLDILVPRSEAYYRQLVGGVSRATTLEDYIAEVTAPFLVELLEEGRQQPLNLAWLLCSHQSISQLIEREWKGDDQALADEILWLAENGDPISCTGAIEVGLRQVQEHPTLTQPLAKLINSFLDGEPDEKTDAFALLAALFRCIYGQMAKCRILTTWQPFARRLAALAHASLVGRHFMAAVEDYTGLVRWLRNENEGYFIIQTLLDMRVEPRWFPELGSAQQWKNELLGRVWLAANLAPETVEALELTERLIGEAPQAVIHQIDRVAALLPGPLEGGANSRIPLASKTTIQIEKSLKGAIETSSFIGLINASMFFRIPDHLVDLAAEALECCHYQIPIGEQVALTDCLLGLASVAAVSRHSKLREAIHTTLRVNWCLNIGQLTAEESLRVGVLACAAHVELVDWTERVGQFMTELALQDLAKEEADALQSHLSFMCHVIPELWGTCGQAHAALGLVIGK